MNNPIIKAVIRDGVVTALRERVRKLESLVENSYYEGFTDGQNYGGVVSMFKTWKHAESNGDLECLDDEEE